MTGPQTPETTATKRQRVAQRAQDPTVQFRSLTHLIDREALEAAYRRIPGGTAPGIDGITRDEYGANLHGNLDDLLARMKAWKYRHQPVKRVYIPKSGGGRRPLGVPTIDDRVVQGAISEVLSLVYEPLFRDCSWGYRPGRSAHDAIKRLDQCLYRERMGWVLEADITSFFDNVDHAALREMLQERVVDRSMIRLIGRCLKAGVSEEGRVTPAKKGVPQGSALSPVLANVYLHHVVDVWFEDEVTPRLQDQATLLRYADDVVMCFRSKADAEKVMAVLGKRLARFGLSLNPEKTRLTDMWKPPHDDDEGSGGLTFLGFDVRWKRSREGNWTLGLKTSKGSLRRICDEIHQWCRSQRHSPVKVQHAALARRINGHFNYFGVNGNLKRLLAVVESAKRSWFKWLRRRSQRARLNWARFNDLLKDHPLPTPRLRKQLWVKVE